MFFIFWRWKDWQMVSQSQWWFIHPRRHVVIDLMMLKILPITAYLPNFNYLWSCHFVLITSFNLLRSIASLINHPVLTSPPYFHICAEFWMRLEVWRTGNYRTLRQNHKDNLTTKENAFVRLSITKYPSRTHHSYGWYNVQYVQPEWRHLQCWNCGIDRFRHGQF